MSHKVYLVEKRGLGCCNMVIWDAIVIILLSVDFFTQIVGIHIVFAILIGLAIFIILFALMNIPKLGKILQVVLGFVWTALVYCILETNMGGFMSKLFVNDPVWYWAALIIASIVFIALHIASVRDINEEEQLNEALSNNSKTYQYNFENNTAYNPTGNENYNKAEAADCFQDESVFTESVFTDDFECDAPDLEDESSKEGDMFFHGCDTLEKLNKRYRNLAKTYHPDTDTGDSEMMKIINKAYEEKKSELENP